MKTLRIDLEGISPLVQHNIRLADKMDEITKAIADITGKRKKTEQDEAAIADLEFLGGLYHDQELGIYVTTWSIQRCLEEAAKVTRQGKAISRAVAFSVAQVPLKYEGPREPKALVAKPEFRWRTSVGVQGKKVTRTRPIFRRWSLSADVSLLEDVLDLDDFVAIVEHAGVMEGLGDARRLGYGRFRGSVTEVA